MARSETSVMESKTATTLAERPSRDLTKNAIKNRPDLSSRAEFGPWERGTIELVHDQNYLVTLVERKTQFLATKLVSNKKFETVRNAILSALDPFPQAIKSITLDNGTYLPTIKPLQIA